MTRNAALFLFLIYITTAAVVFACTSSATNRGQEVYAEYCVRCHNVEPNIILPPQQLVQSWTDADVKTRLVATLLYGASGGMSPDSLGRRRGMPPIPYGDADVAAVATYVLSTSKWAGGVVVTTRDVQKVREQRQGLQKITE